MNELLRYKLHNLCKKFVENKKNVILKTIQSNQEALDSETKSSAGDKHETGRAMLQLEMEKASQQLEVVYNMHLILNRMNHSESSEIIRLGSIVKTNIANYYLSISVGELEVEGCQYYAISANSPIGKLLLGKRVGETLTFHKQIEILKID